MSNAGRSTAAVIISKYTRYMYNDDPLRQPGPHTRSYTPKRWQKPHTRTHTLESDKGHTHTHLPQNPAEQGGSANGRNVSRNVLGLQQEKALPQTVVEVILSVGDARVDPAPQGAVTSGRLRSNSLSMRCMVLFVKSGNGFPHTASACFRQGAPASREAPVHIMRTAGLTDGFCRSKQR